MRFLTYTFFTALGALLMYYFMFFYQPCHKNVLPSGISIELFPTDSIPSKICAPDTNQFNGNKTNPHHGISDDAMSILSPYLDTVEQAFNSTSAEAETTLKKADNSETIISFLYAVIDSLTTISNRRRDTIEGLSRQNRFMSDSLIALAKEETKPDLKPYVFTPYVIGKSMKDETMMPSVYYTIQMGQSYNFLTKSTNTSLIARAYFNRHFSANAAGFYNWMAHAFGASLSGNVDIATFDFKQQKNKTNIYENKHE